MAEDITSDGRLIIYDRSIHVHGDVGNVATGDGHRGDMVVTLGDIPQEKLQKEITVELDKWTEGMVKTSAFEKVMELLNKGITWITIKGSPGEGKTTVAKMALRELQKSGRKVFQARTPIDFNTAVKNYSSPVILLDDILGDLEFDETAWKVWKPIFKKVLDVKEHHSHKQGITKYQKEDITVILVGRDYVLKSASVPMGRMFDYITKPLHVVDMSHSVRRSYEEKKKIWDAVIGTSGIFIPLESVNYVFQLDGGHGFPHVCRLFVTMQKEIPTICAEKFFKTPLVFLNETIKIFLENEMKLKLFKAMISRKGKISERDLQGNGHHVIKTAHELMGTYLRMERGYFMFDHPSIYDSVALNLCKYHTLFVIENCTLSFLNDRIRVEPSHNSLNGPHSSDNGLVMYISQSFYRDLAVRFALEIASRNFLPLSHQACTHEVFVKEIMSQLTSPDKQNIKLSELLQMTDINYVSILGRFLCFAVSNKSPQLMKYIDNHPDVHLNQEDIKTVLYGVCRYAASEILSYLHQNHMIDRYINVKYGNIETPLSVASQTRNAEFVRQILSLKPNINSRDMYNKTALHYMCILSCESVVRQVVETVADINVGDDLGKSPLCYACERGYVDLVKLLVKHGANTECKDNRGFTPLHQVAKRGSDECISVLLQAGADVNVQTLDGFTPLHEAAETGSKGSLELLLKADSDVNVRSKDGCTPLHQAAFKGHRDCVYLLLRAGAEVNAQDINGFTSLHKAAASGYKECVELLLQTGADANVSTTYDITSLHNAAKCGSKECVKMLLKVGSYVNAQDTMGRTPLHNATLFRHEKCVSILLKAGADVNLQDTDGFTPLHTAAHFRSKNCVDFFLQAGASVNAQTKEGLAPLHKAIYRSIRPGLIFLPDISVCEILIRNGANVNITDREGNTPLHLLCCVGSNTLVLKDSRMKPASVSESIFQTVISFFVESGADVNMQNMIGEQALSGWCRTLFLDHQSCSKT